MNNENQLPPGEASSLAISPDRLTRYMRELDDIEATEEQKLELLGVVFSIMRSFVELGFDVGGLDVWGIANAEADPGSVKRKEEVNDDE